MSKITLIVWSKDRACQCHLLGTSIQKYAKSIFETNIIYKYSNDSFRDGYHRLIESELEYEDYQDIFTFHLEKDFEEITKRIIRESKNEYIAFSTDDSVFYRGVTSNGFFKGLDKVILQNALPKYNNEVFSFRLGYNTIIQNCHTGQLQPPLNIHVNHGGWLSWPIAMYNPHDNYGYPFGLDLHVFRRDLLLPIMEEIEFKSTNELESILTTNYRHKIDELRSFEHSVAVNIPINSVTQVTRAGEQHPLSKEELNQKFLDGYIIDLENISKQDIRGCHAELPLNLIKNTKM